MTILISCLFVLGYALITLEHKYSIHKAITAALLGSLLWIVLALSEGGVEAAVEEAGAEIFSLVIFLLGAMTLVEILVHYRFFDAVRSQILRLRLPDKSQFWVIGVVSFFLSSVIDNLTATLVMLAIAMRFFKRKNLLIAAAGIVIAANAGGAWSPIGDVTTIMLWIGKKFSAADVMLWGFLPSMMVFIVSAFLLSKNISADTRDSSEENVAIRSSEWTVICAALGSFALPLVAHQIGLPPYFGILFGLGLTGAAASYMRHKETTTKNENPEFPKISHGRDTHLTMDIERKLASTDIAALVFFAGILLSVSALDHVGILDKASEFLLGAVPSIWRLFFGIGTLGILSAIVDNIPLTAAAMEIITVSDTAIWVLLALAVGTGGSILIIGSAAGVVAMGQVKELEFFKYLKIAALPAFAGYAAGLTVWLVEYVLVRGL